MRWFHRRRGGRVCLVSLGLACALAGTSVALWPGAPAKAGAEAATEGTEGFEPSTLTLFARTRDVLVLGTIKCGKEVCPELWRVGGSGNSERLALPPGTTATHAGLIHGATNFVFANQHDGYAFSGPVPGTQSFFTSDGGHSWRTVSPELSGELDDIVATSNYFYGLISQCTALKNGLDYCSYRLGRSAVGAPHWSSVAIPGAGHLLEGYISLAAQADEVWIYLNPQSAGTPPAIVKSEDGLPPFSQLSEPRLQSVVTCGIAPAATSVAWATCGTGMMVSYLRTTDSGSHWTQWWESSGTGGDVFDPVSATVAYRYTGDVGPGVPRTLERTTDGGKKFIAVAHLVLTGGVQVAFVDVLHGYVLGSERPAGGIEAFNNVLLYTNDGGQRWWTVLGSSSGSVLSPATGRATG